MVTGPALSKIRLAISGHRNPQGRCFARRDRKALCSGDGQGKCLGVFHYESRRRQRGCGFRVGWGCFRASFRLWEASGRERGRLARAPRRQKVAVGA